MFNLKDNSAIKNNKAKNIPEPTIRRFPLYLNTILDFKQEGRTYISCTDIGNRLSLTAIQVRKDIEHTSIAGKPKVGYDIDALTNTIRDFLGWNDLNEAFLIGVGHLGSALLGYQGFENYGFRITKAFDNDKSKIGKNFFGKEIFDIEKLPDMIMKDKIKICVLTVPAEFAQQIVDKVKGFGIKAIWNFSPVHLDVPDNIIVENENLAASLCVLTSKL